MTDITAVEFESHGITVRGAHFRGQGTALATDQGRPCVVMAHGLGGVRAARLDAFAERFAQAGLDALVFDYRCFGDSDGEPRQHLNIRAQLDDWAAAIAHARTLKGVDGKRIALWGSSFSGGHVVVAAVEDGRVQAVSSQGPMMDGLAALVNVMRYAGPLQVAQLTAHAAWDALGAVAGLRHRIALVAPPGGLAAMSSHDAQSGYRAIVPQDWINEVTAAWMLQLPLYRPLLKAARLPCPILICICTKDSVAPPAAAEDAARRAGPRAEVKRYDIGHFDIYVGDGFERAVADQIEFFTRALKPAGDGSS
ncbi:alpha/beta fold hydrolase [Fontimonas sp. SYSU GA230001]|uniref:alpha/beta hydrolase n=1 Tax=Fontimonas sp. SYSU GA230001 TaxID=3142450 RepID=UPI0032B618E7